MNNLACTLIFLLGWFAMAGYMNYKIWWKPDEIWQLRQENVARSSDDPHFFARLLRIDLLGTRHNRGRFIWFERVVAAVLLLLGVLMLVGAVGEMVR